MPEGTACNGSLRIARDWIPARATTAHQPLHPPSVAVAEVGLLHERVVGKVLG